MTLNTPLPIDIETMRTTAHRLLADDAEPHTPDELQTLTLQLRGHLMLAIPEVETAILAVPEDTEARTAALACISEARRHMGVEPGRSQPADIAHAQRLARSIDALCRQYEALNCGQVTDDHWSPAQLAFRRWAITGRSAGSAEPTTATATAADDWATIGTNSAATLRPRTRQLRAAPQTGATLWADGLVRSPSRSQAVRPRWVTRMRITSSSMTYRTR